MGVLICCSVGASSGKAADLEEHSAMTDSTLVSRFAEFSPRPHSVSLVFSDSIAPLIIYERRKRIIKTTSLTIRDTSKTISYHSRINTKLQNLTILLVLFDKVGGERSIIPNSGSSAWIVGKTHGPRSSAINLGNVGFSCPGRAVNIREKSSLLKCSEQIFECFDGFHLARLRSTKSTHLFRLLTHSGRSSPKNGILWRPIPLSGFAVSLQP